jgi:hypothetical protein
MGFARWQVRGTNSPKLFSGKFVLKLGHGKENRRQRTDSERVVIGRL